MSLAEERALMCHLQCMSNLLPPRDEGCKEALRYHTFVFYSCCIVLGTYKQKCDFIQLYIYIFTCI